MREVEDEMRRAEMVENIEALAKLSQRAEKYESAENVVMAVKWNLAKVRLKPLKQAEQASKQADQAVIKAGTEIFKALTAMISQVEQTDIGNQALMKGEKEAAGAEQKVGRERFCESG